MKSGFENSISSQKIMLPKNQALAGRWGNNKQEDWGKRCNSAILAASDMLKKGKFNDTFELYNYLANARAFIGYLLNHPAEVGQLRSPFAIASTPISNTPNDPYTNSNPYEKMHPEFASLLDAILEGDQRFFFISNENVLILKDVYQEESGEQISYERSAIRDYKGPNFVLVHVRNLAPLFRQANEQFKKLIEKKTLSIDEKHACIEAIYYYLADAMPCERGSAAIAQMMFYALEDAFTDNMRYLGKMSSRYGHSEGILPDLAAMLSPSLDSFRAYFNENIVDNDIVVNKDLPEIEVELMSLDSILNEIAYTQMKVQEYILPLERFRNPREYAVEYYQFRNASKFNSILSYIKEEIEKNRDNEVMLKYYQEAYQRAKEIFVNDLLCYYNFYPLVKDQSNWPSPEIHQYKDFSLQEKMSDYLIDIGNYLHKLNDFSSNYLVFISNKTYIESYHRAGRIISDLNDLILRVRKLYSFEDPYFVFNIIEKKINETPNIRLIIDEMIEIVDFFEKEKRQGISKSQTIQNMLKKIEGSLKDASGVDYDRVSYLEYSLSNIYDNSKAQKLSLLKLAPLLTDHLKNKEILEDWRNSQEYENVKRPDALIFKQPKGSDASIKETSSPEPKPKPRINK